MSGLKPDDRFDRINEARKTLAQIIGGIAVLAGFYSTVQNLNLSRRQFALAEQGQITDRLTKAIEQLGAVDSKGQKKLEVRLGGIYALARIANESERDHWPIMEVLSAYVRDNASKANQQQPKQTLRIERFPDIKPTTDIQAILTVLATRDARSEHADQILNLRETDMQGARLRGAHFRGASLREVNLRQANLTGADLSGADLSGANLSAASLAGANLSGAEFDKADLRGATLREANLRGAYLGADLSGAQLKGADLSEANLYGANLSGAHLDFAHLGGAYLGGLDLSTAKGLGQEQINSSRGDPYTKLPPNLRMPEAWKTYR